jgi:serine/threonine protein kinase
MAQPGLKLEPGQFFGTRFQIVSLLGRGAMGVVYRARDHEAQREVALKILSSSANPATVSRFVREGELTAALRHPGIVTVHSGGAVGAYPYLAYELVPDAQTLDDLIPRLDHKGRGALLLRIAEAVGYAHEQGIFHRDLKPENVLVTPEGEPRVADFGLASGRDLDRLTQSGAMIGTPSYMSPEQISGQRESIGAASDVWSLGVMLYEALTGRLPFEADSILSLAAAVMREDPKPPRSLDPSVPQSLEAVCLAAIRREPEQRYPDANAFAADLAAALRGERPSAGSSSTFERAIGTKGSRKRRTLTLVLLMVPALIVLAGGIWFALRGADTPSHETPSASAGASLPDQRESARKAWAEVRGEANPLAQLLALEGWLQRYPESELRPQAVELARIQAQRQAIRFLPQDRVDEIRFTSPTKLLTVGQGQLRAWDLTHPAPTPVWATAFEDMAFYGAVYLDQERFLVSLQGGISVVDQEGARQIDPTLRGQWVSMAFDAASRRLATSRVSGKLVWGHLTAEARYRDRRGLGSEFGYYRSLALSRGGRYLAAGAGDLSTGCGVCVWDLEQQTESLLAPQTVIRIGFEADRVCFTPDGKEVVLLDDSGGLHLVSLATKELRSFSSAVVKSAVRLAGHVAHMGRIKGVLFLNEGRVLTCSRGSKLVGKGQNSLGLWNLASGEELGRLLSQPVRYRCLALSPDGLRLAVGREGKVEIRSAWAVPGDALPRPLERE